MFRFKVNYDEPYFNCSSVALSIFLKQLDAKARNVSDNEHLVTFTFQKPIEEDACLILINDTGLSRFLPVDSLDELLLYNYGLDETLYSRIYFIFNGITPGTSLQRELQETQVSSAGTAKNYAISPYATNDTIFFDRLWLGDY